MKKRIGILFFAGVFATLAVVAFSCKKTKSTMAGGGTDSVLINIGNNIILPAYEQLTSTTVALDAAITDFNTAPDATKLANVQTLFKSAYVAWQSASEYNGLGPAMSNQPAFSGLNLFPVTTTIIDSNIIAGNYNINVLANATAKGFPALDYLLFSDGGSGVLANYTTDVHAANRKQYLAAVSADIKAEVSAVYNAWQPTGGNYVNIFATNTGNSISGSLGLLINSLDQDLEVLKNDKLGIPLGKQPPGTTLPVLPKEVEGYYSGISVQLALAQLKTIQSVYTGVMAGSNGMGLDHYVVAANAQFNNGPLSDTIKTHFAQAVTDMQSIPDPLSATIQSNPLPADNEYTEIQRLVVLMKTDMPSSLGILITYGDNDGD